MAITQAYVMSAVTIGVTPISVVSGTTTVNDTAETGVFQLWVDGVTNMVKGDEFRIVISEKVKATGTRRTVFQAILSDVQAELFVTPMLCLIHGWNMTITRTGGSDRAFDASIRKIA